MRHADLPDLDRAFFKFYADRIKNVSSSGAGATGPSGGGSSASGSAGSTGTGYGAASGSRAGAHSIAITRLRVSRPWLSTTGPAAHRTTTLNFHLRTRARVIFTVTQIAPECRLAGHFVFNGRAGFNKVAFSGRIGGRPLAPGTYRISARVPGGTTLLRVVVVIVDTAPSPTELDRARHADVCAAARLLAANATLASGGAAGSTGSGASQHPGATSEIVRNQTAAASTRTSSHTSSSKNGGHATAAPFTPARVSGNATNPLVILALATAVVLLGLAALPQRAIPDPRLTHVLAQHRLEVAFAGIHATPLRLAGFDVEVCDDDPRAVERAGAVVDGPEGRYDAVVAREGADLSGVDAENVILVRRDGTAYMRA